jgi:hypothetical protein
MPGGALTTRPVPCPLFVTDKVQFIEPPVPTSASYPGHTDGHASACTESTSGERQKYLPAFRENSPLTNSSFDLQLAFPAMRVIKKF